jgi:hypothetical protein
MSLASAAGRRPKQSELRSRPCRRFKQSVSICISGAAYESDIERAIKAGATAYVIKPDLDGLFETIMQSISNSERLNAAQAILTVEQVSIQVPLTHEIAVASYAVGRREYKSLDRMLEHSFTPRRIHVSRYRDS